MARMVAPFTHDCPWPLSVTLWRYLALCAVASLVLRIVFFIFRALAVVRGDFPDSDGESQPGKGWGFWRAFRVCFGGFSDSKAHADLWLNFLLGFCELAAYPVLFGFGYFSTVGGWLALKTAGNWGGWTVSRTSFNRFLLNNILELAISYLWLMRYVQGCGGADLPPLAQIRACNELVEPFMHYGIANLPNWIQALAAIGLVFLTGWTLKVLRGYARDTAALVKTGNLQLEKMDMPFLALVAKQPEIGQHNGGWAIENHGKGTAINTRHSVPTGDEGWVETVSPLAVGAFIFLPTFNIDVMRNHVFTIEYESLIGNRYKTTVEWPNGAMHTQFLVSVEQ